MAVRYRELLRELASENDGYLTPRLAEDAGVPAVELRKLASRGAFDKRQRGVYRDPYYPISDDDRAREYLLMLGEEAYIADESVLAFLHVADVNPRKMVIASPRRHQRSFPEELVVRKQRDNEKTTYYRGLHCQQAADALRAVSNKILPERALHAIEELHLQGLLTRSESAELKAEFGNA